MQLLIILALLLYGGKSGGKNMLSEVRPVLESLGGEEIKEALKSADEITEVLSAVQAFAGGMVGGEGNARPAPSRPAESEPSAPAIAFPLAPVANVADREITYSLSRYFSQEESRP